MYMCVYIYIYSIYFLKSLYVHEDFSNHSTFNCFYRRVDEEKHVLKLRHILSTDRRVLDYMIRRRQTYTRYVPMIKCVRSHAAASPLVIYCFLAAQPNTPLARWSGERLCRDSYTKCATSKCAD